MAIDRLDVRLGPGHRHKVQELAAERGISVSEIIRRLTDRAYKESLSARRHRAAQALAELEIEDVPDSATLSHQLGGAYEC